MFLVQLLLSALLLERWTANCEKIQCNPITSEKACPPSVALALSLVEDFKQESEHFEYFSSPEMISYSENGLVLTIDRKFQNPGIKSKFKIMFGKVEAIMKAAEGNGIISSLYLQSSALDEIDLEWFGSDPYEVQTNYFSKGNVTTYDRGGYHAVSDPQNEMHNYTIDWTEERLTWYVDSKPVRTLLSSSKEGYPQTPMAIYLGIWAGGDPENSLGTIAWAGGATDYIGVPYNMVVSRLIVTDYSTGSAYSYKDRSGLWESIEAHEGEVNGRKEVANLEFSALVEGESVGSRIKRNYSQQESPELEIESSMPMPSRSGSSKIVVFSLLHLFLLSFIVSLSIV